MKSNIIQLNNDVQNDNYIKEILDLWNKNTIETAECELDESDRKAIYKMTEEYIHSKHGAVFIAVDENQHTIGYGIASVKQDLVSGMLIGQVDEIYVLPEYRRQKLAKNIVDTLMNWFNQQDISLVHVYVDLDNELAMAFWEKAGLNKEFYILSNN
ncbi:GNAT family N-acetyltransferase [Bacillus sp. JJ722]|uniref:GNAT family N-acetyltransferase n=1 Tax=Bacillus sp. JJ722 TaxID=3122973 RepID=UPI002FFE911A